jgi:hypothetical protein
MADDDEMIDLQPAPPPEPAKRLRERNDLGGRRWTGAGLLPPNWSRAIVPGVLAVVAATGGAMLCTGAGHVVSRQDRPTGWLATALAAGTLGVVAVARARSRGVISVIVYEDGLVYTRGGRTQAFRWADVTAVSEQRFTLVNPLGRPIGRGHSLRFQCQGGAEHDLEVGGIAESDAVSGYVHQGTLEFLVPQAEAELAASRPVSFGPLAATPAGLSLGRDFLAWEQLASLEVIDGKLVVGRKDDPEPWFEQPTWAVPNTELLLNLIEARFFGPGAGKDKPGASRFSLLDRYQPSAGAPRIGY